MYIILNSNKEAFGPFGSERRAKEYAEAAGLRDQPIIPLIVPYLIVKQIVWRDNNN